MQAQKQTALLFNTTSERDQLVMQIKDARDQLDESAALCAAQAEQLEAGKAQVAAIQQAAVEAQQNQAAYV